MSDSGAVSNEYAPPPWSAVPLEHFSLEVLKEGKIIQEIPLKDKSFYLLGRQQDAVDILMEHPSISRKHAVLNFRDDGALMLRDLGSAQGTLLNKKPCSKDTYYKVYVGDLIKFGASTRQYIVNGPESFRPQEYDSLNMQNYREKLEKRSIKAKERKEEEESEGISWGFQEDAPDIMDSNDDDDKEKNQNKDGKLPSYLQKDENYDRKFGEKFSVTIQEGDIKNEKDQQILEKIRKKERKIQNMQEENRRIYMKEYNQDNGLTDGQVAAVTRNDQNIVQLTEEIKQLTKSIELKNAEREGLNAVDKQKKKRKLEDNEDELLDVSKDNLDINTNWRLRKKLSKNSSILLNNGKNEKSESMGYKDIKEQLEKENQEFSKLVDESNKLENNLKEIESKKQKFLENEKIDEVEIILVNNKISEWKGELQRYKQEKSKIELKQKKLEELLKLATPAIKSLITEKTRVNKEKTETIINKTTNKPNQEAKVQEKVGKDELAEIFKPTNTIFGLKSGLIDENEENAHSSKKLETLISQIEEDKKKEEEFKKLQINHETADTDQKIKTVRSPEIVHEKIPVNEEKDTAVSTKKVKGPSAPKNKIPMKDNTKNIVFSKDMLEGGEYIWVPPKTQKGDGKTSLNEKLGY